MLHDFILAAWLPILWACREAYKHLRWKRAVKSNGACGRFGHVDKNDRILDPGETL